jgi:hypothetical protein
VRAPIHFKNISLPVLKNILFEPKMQCVYPIRPLYKVMATQASIAHLNIYGKFIFLLEQFLLGNHPDEYHRSRFVIL